MVVSGKTFLKRDTTSNKIFDLFDFIFDEAHKTLGTISCVLIFT